MTDLVPLRLTSKVTVWINVQMEHFDPWSEERRAAWAEYATAPETVDLDPSDTDAVVGVLLAAPESRRTKLAEVISYVASDAQLPPGRSHVPRVAADLRATLQVCQFGGITATALRKRWFHPQLFDLEPVVADDAIPLWNARPPASQAAWLRAARSLLGERPEWWFVLRFLELRCAAVVPHDVTYLRAAWESRDPYGHFRFHPDGAAAVATSMAADPVAALEMAHSLALPEIAEYLGSFGKAIILERLLGWTAAGIVPRDAVLSAALAGLAQPQRPGAGAALRRVVEGLKPSAQELAPHARHVMGALVHGHASEQATASAWLASTADAGASFPREAAAAALAAAIERATVTGARTIIAAAKKICDEQGLREVARAGLANGKDDVRILAVKELAALKSVEAADAEALDTALAAASPKVRAAIESALARIGGMRPTAQGQRPRASAALDSALATLAELRTASPVTPLASVEELAATLTAFLGGGASGLDVELILDAMSRYPASALAPDRREALARTCKRNLDPVDATGLHRSKRVLGAIDAWLRCASATPFRRTTRRATLLDVAKERFAEAATAAATGARASVTLPADSHGSLSVEDFEHRLVAAKKRGLPWEEACARARVAAGEKPLRIEGVEFTAHRTAYGWQSPKISYTVSQPRAARVADLRDAFAPPSKDHAGAWRTFMAESMRYDVSPATVEWVVLSFPHDREIVFAAAADALLRDPTEGGRLRHEDSAISALTWGPFGIGGQLLLVAAWWSTITGARDVAIDVAGLLAAAGELPSVALGNWCAKLSSAQAPGLGRCAAALGELAEGPAGARTVHEIAEAFAGGAPGVHREVSRMLEVWEVAADRAGGHVESPAARAWLGEVAVGTSKRATAARRLLALEAS